MKSHPLFYIWLWSIFKNVKFWSQGAYSNFIDVYLLIFILHALHRRLHRDRHRMRDILNLHLVRDRLNTERIRQGNLQTVSCIPFLSLFFLLYSLTVHSFLSQFETFFPRLTSIVMQSQNFHKLYEVQDHWTMDKFVFFHRLIELSELSNVKYRSQHYWVHVINWERQLKKYDFFFKLNRIKL